MKHPDYSLLPFAAFDAETHILNVGPDAIGKHKAAPYHPDNGIVWWGVTTGHIPLNDERSRYPAGKWGDSEFKISNRADELFISLKGVKVLVGHNIKFDLLHMMQYPLVCEVLTNWLKDGGVIWDTMLAEYLLTGQKEMFINLDKLSLQNGGTVKDDRLKEEYWKKDIDTAFIPDTIIIPYLKEDLRNTAINYVAQLGQIESLREKQRGALYALIHSQMEALLATTMIEFNGIHFDIPSAADAAATLAVKHDMKEKWLKEQMSMWFEIHNSTPYPVTSEDVNPGSIQQLSALLVEGAFKMVRKCPIMGSDGKPQLYKSGVNKGKIKKRNEDIIIHVDGMMKHNVTDLVKTDKGYKLDDFSLKKLMNHSHVKDNPAIKATIEGLISWRSLSKELTVSYMGLLKLTWPTDSCIHGNMNHTATSTGRLSSSAPNQQNFSAKEAKE